MKKAIMILLALSAFDSVQSQANSLRLIANNQNAVSTRGNTSASLNHSSNQQQPNQPSVSPYGKPPIQDDLSGLVWGSHEGKCFQRQYKLEAGRIEVSFNYKVISKVPVKESAVYLNLNGKPVYKVLPVDSGQNIKVQGDLPQGTHTLGFCLVGSPNQPEHLVSITNFELKQLNQKPQPKQQVCKNGDLIVNGGFQQNQCNRLWCIWGRPDGIGKVTGWEPSPQIEVGRGSVYNSVLGNSWVSELDPNRNSCMKQRISMAPGKYTLKFDWAARRTHDLASSQFEVKVNDRVLKSYQAASYKLNKEFLNFDLNDVGGDAWLEFCGTGTNDSYGAAIDNVQLFQKC